MDQYMEAGLPSSEAVSAYVPEEVAQARPERRLGTSVRALDDFVGGFPSSKVTLIDSSDRLVLDIVFIVNLADDLLQQVFQRHQAGSTAEFVHHDGDMLPVVPELVQQIVHRQGFGDKNGLAGQLTRPGPSLRG